MIAPANPASLGDLYTNVVTTKTAVATDQTNIATLTATYQASLQSFNGVLDADQSAASAADAALGQGVSAQGGFFIVNTDGSATAVEPNGAGGYVTKTLLPASTPITPPPALPAPTV